jgi:succinoglycan biosynthesis transport protein ExoP
LTRSSRISAATITVSPPEPNLAVIPEPPAPQGMSMAQAVAILRAYWKQIAVITLLVAGLGGLAIKLLPKTYTATATLIVNSEVRDPLAGRDFPVAMITSYVSTQIELINSPIVQLPVVDKLHLVEDKNFSAGLIGNKEELRESVQKNLSSAIQVERGTGGELLYVSASAKNAAKAADIANAVADVYIDQDQRRFNDPAAERAQRYSEELAQLREKVSTAQEKVTAFNKANGIGDISAGTVGLEEQSLEVLHQHLVDTQNLRRSLEAKQVGVPSVDAPNGTATTVLTSQATLDTQLAQLAQLSSTYGPQHPKVRELNAQIALTRQALADERHAITANTEAQLSQAKELERKYQQAIAEQEVTVTKVRQAQAEGGKLLLELDSAKAVYKQALDGFDQIMFQAVANHTNVSIVLRAVPPLKASKPNKPKLMLMALAAALAAGLGLPLMYGLFFTRRLRCRDDLERDFGIAVLAQLDAVPTLVRAT